jgi:hypothetical protein
MNMNNNIFWLLALTIISTQNVFAQSTNELLADDKAWKWAPPRHGLKTYIFTKMTSKKPFEYLAVDYMKLPLGRWQYEVPYTGLPRGYCINLTGQKDPKLKLCFSCSGRCFADDHYFKNILKQEPHELTKDERESIHIADFFTTAHTENLNGKRVIVMSGHFDQDNEDLYRIMFNHNPEASNTAVSGDIEFSAPPAEYKRHLAAVKKAFKTIRWNNVHIYKPE